MRDLLLALGLLLAIEGTLYAAFPAAMKAAVKMILDLPDQTVRFVGVGSLAIGVMLVWLVRG